MNTVYIVAATRTPIGSFGGVFLGMSATDLGAIAIQGAITRAGIIPELVEEVFMGNVCSANLGQAPARQAAIHAGIGYHVPCTTVNKVCASGAKAIMLAAQSIMLGMADIIVAGGMESMSNIPYYLPQARWGYKYGHAELVDGLAKDGLTDVYNGSAMGVCADQTAERYQISREMQDEYAMRSYRLAAESSSNGFFEREITPVSVPQRKGDPIWVKEDEEYKKVDFSKIPTLKAAFSKGGTVTPANASTINDGAVALVLMSERKVKELGLTPLARIVSFADAAHEPEWFTTAPAKAAPIALQRAGLTPEDIHYWEVNEAFAVVPLVFNQLLNIDPEKVNVQGGAVAIGHPLGASGARIVTTLLHILDRQSGKYGMAAICNGGGGASAIVVERL